MDELRASPALLPLDSTFGESNIQIRVVDDPTQEPLLEDIWQAPSQVRQYRLLAVEVDGQTYTENIRRDIDASVDAEFTEKELIDICQQQAISSLQLEVNTILLLANILRPGALSADVGYAFIGKKQGRKTTPFFAEHLFSAVEATPPPFSVALSIRVRG